MSSTTIYRITSNNPNPHEGLWQGTKIGEYRNSHGFVTRIWKAMGDHYMGGFNPSQEAPGGERSQEFWNLARNPDMPLYQGLVLRLTFDYAWVEAHSYRYMAHAIKMFDRNFPVDSLEVENHLPAIAQLLTHEEFLGAVDPSNTVRIGVCFHGTSCGENLWEVTSGGDWDEEKQKYNPSSHRWWSPSLDARSPTDLGHPVFHSHSNAHGVEWVALR